MAAKRRPDHYGLLQVHPRASHEVIQAAYRALIKLHHPDTSETAGETAVALNAAYEVLSDPRRRKDYDRELRVEEAGVKVVGDYRVLKQIAEGGFGKTYKGEHILTGGPVCIKHCSEISADNEEILIEEARAMWDLRHYAIPAVRNLLRLPNGSMALVMSFIEGPTIAQLVEKHGPIDPEHVAWIAQRVLSTLMYIHAHGIIHGDLKPQNIIIQPNTHNAVLVDFGLAMIKPKSNDRAKGYTDLFAPPEQLKGEVLIPESDLFSLGMTMIFALCGGDVKRTQTKQVPATVPDPLCSFILRLIVLEPLSRPRVWAGENLCETIEVVRKQEFGRVHSNMKPLAL
jgi:serine/threonine protein kinase